MPQTLLKRLRENPADADAWQRFDALYRPMLRNWLRRYCLQRHDTDDLVQQALEVVVRELPHFAYDPRNGTFPAWLRAVLNNRLREFWRSRKARPVATGDSEFNEWMLTRLADHRNDHGRVCDREHARHVIRRLLARIEADFAPTTWQVFLRVMSGDKAADVAADLGISVNAVHLTKSHVLRRLREEIGGLPQ
jgi:RNA polymerase sigma-70 factor (ECF subfamily)